MFEMLFTVTVFTGFMIVLRCVFKNHISAGVRYGLWLLVAIKLLVFPIPKVEGNFSVLGLVPYGEDRAPAAEEISGEALREAEMSGYAEETQSGVTVGDGNLWNADGQTGAGSAVSGTDAGTAPEYVKIRKAPVGLLFVWAAGSVVCAAVMMIYHFRLKSYLRINRVKLREENLTDRSAGPERERPAVYSVKGLPTPCLFGGSIYVPAGIAEDAVLLPYVLRHERSHYRHGDHIWGILRMVCVCLYWYHPLVWLAAYLSRQDCELACDEAVVRRMEEADRKRYGELLLALAPVKSSPADCFSMTTAMSGNARNLRERLRRIAEKNPGRKKGRLIPGIGAAALGLAGICGCITSGFVSPERQWQVIRIKEQEGSTPVVQENYGVEYRLSEDAASYGFYLEQYEYGELVAAEVLDCAPLQKSGERKGRVKRGEAFFWRTLESDETTGAFVKSANSYSVQDYTVLQADGAASSFRAFTTGLPEGSIGNSFSASAEETAEHRFRMNEDIILFADYYGDERGLSVPGRHCFKAEEYMAEAGEILKSDRCVILTHLVISDKSSEELERQLEELVLSR